jgi:hypothetical protein
MTALFSLGAISRMCVSKRCEVKRSTPKLLCQVTPTIIQPNDSLVTLKACIFWQKDLPSVSVEVRERRESGGGVKTASRIKKTWVYLCDRLPHRKKSDRRFGAVEARERQESGGGAETASRIGKDFFLGLSLRFTASKKRDRRFPKKKRFFSFFSLPNFHRFAKKVNKSARNRNPRADPPIT